jgi:formylglycine-generating enzyme required for sulfatase activity
VPSNGNSVTRSASARWVLPSEDEWYKAAYFDAGSTEYFEYPTGTNALPNNNLPSADTGNSANFFQDGDYTTGNFDYPLTDAAGYLLSASPYGTLNQGGNVWEWTDTPTFLFQRRVRGGMAAKTCLPRM